MSWFNFRFDKNWVLKPCFARKEKNACCCFSWYQLSSASRARHVGQRCWAVGVGAGRPPARFCASVFWRKKISTTFFSLFFKEFVLDGVSWFVFVGCCAKKWSETLSLGPPKFPSFFPWKTYTVNIFKLSVKKNDVTTVQPAKRQFAKMFRQGTLTEGEVSVLSSLC